MSKIERPKFAFDKFVKDICKREDDGRERIKGFEELEESPQRKYNRLHTENWRNRTRMEKIK